MEILAVFTPLLGFLIAGLFGKQIGDKGAQFVTCLGMIIAATCSVMLFFDVALLGNIRQIQLADWLHAGDLSVQWALRVDQLTVVMMCVVNIVSTCVHIYSVGYMSHDKSQARFMAYLSLFTFAMLTLVTSDNLLQLFFGWEGVGVASYLLIGFWNHKPSANIAATKAFVVNRVGDFGLLLGIFAIFVVFGTISFDGIFEQAASKTNTMLNLFGFEIHAITAICFLLFIGAMGKSAQLGLHTWLPDAMEGPTPVSALIHAATMVTAGVFLVARFSPLYEYAPDALMFIAVVGATTAFVAATIGMTQFDIKRVIAYSTMSQLGYMFFALGVSAYGAAIFHLMTHAFFKALLFLGAGSVIHAMSDEQDMRQMGGIWKKIPITYVMMWIGSLALAGIPYFSGYFSKDIILEAAWADHTWFGNYAFWMGIAAAFMTAFYSWRLIIMTFHGKPRANDHVMSHVHESPFVMLLPLFTLAIGAIFAGYVFYGAFVGSPHHEPVAHDNVHAEMVVDEKHDGAADAEAGVSAKLKDIVSWDKDHFWAKALYVMPDNDTVEAAHHVPYWVKKLPIGIAVAGILLAYLAYMWTKNAIPSFFTRAFKPIYNLFFRKWYFDEAYNAVFVKNSWDLGRLFTRADRKVIDGLGPDGVSSFSQRVAASLSKFQSGYMFQYAFVMMIGLVAIVTWVFYKMTVVG
jgi:NADH-quinone oxidoreductase subunit L